jgi:hypothetical protein
VEQDRIKKRFEKIGTLVIEAFVGPRPEGLYVCHKNGVPWDNRLSNLYYGTPQQNSDDKRLHGTHLEGERLPHSKLTEQQIREIRSLKGCMYQRDIAKKFGIAQGHVCRILNNVAWKHLDQEADAA